MREEHFPAGSTVVAEGEEGDRLFVLAEGRVEVTVEGPDGPAPVASLGRGEYFGEIALLDEHGRREATATAETDLHALSLSRTAFVRLLGQYPEARRALRSVADDLLVVKFLKQATPFSALDPARLTSLGGRLEQVSVPAGATVVAQGEPAEDCYLVVQGQVEVVLEQDAQEPRRIATLDRGAIFGEAALLTESPRNATVRALKPCRLLRLRRADLMEVLSEEGDLERTLLESVRLRGRPERVDTVLVYERVNASGETITILKDPVRAAYFQLSSDGRFLWDRLDGTRTLRDLVVDYWDEYRVIAPHVVAESIERLLAAGFLALPSPSDQLRASAELPFRKRAFLHLRRLVEWYLPVRGVDGVVAR